MTEQQLRLLQAIANFTEVTGRGCSFVEIRGHAGFTSRSATTSRLRSLERIGAITKQGGNYRPSAIGARMLAVLHRPPPSTESLSDARGDWVRLLNEVDRLRDLIAGQILG